MVDNGQAKLDSLCVAGLPATDNGQAKLDQATELAGWLGIKTAAGTTAFSDRIGRWQDASGARAASWRFAAVQAALRADPATAADLKTGFTELAGLETELGELMRPASELEAESYGELLFLGEHTRGLNFVPFFLTLWSVLRIYVLPGLSMLIPLLVIILPYFIIRFFFNMPMNGATYWDILYKMLKGQMPIGNGSSAANTNGSNGLNPMKFLSQLAWAGGTLFQAVAQPYWNYKHLRKVDEIIIGKAACVRKLRHLYDRIASLCRRVGITVVRNPLTAAPQREALADLLTDPVPARHCLRLLGQLEATVALATAPGICPVRFSGSGSAPRFVDCFDYNVPAKANKPFTVDFSAKPHMLLTGPNRGGKSTVLRAVATSVTLAHTYGCAFGTDCQLPYFARLDCCLKPDDLPGTKSRFEREVDFTAGTLKGDGPVFVLIDELYHSTNPPDALEACRYYCQRLWTKPGAYSIISTHIFQLVEEADDGVQRMCCPAEDLGEGKIRFLYGLCEGICRVSSVHELMRKAFICD